MYKYDPEVVDAKLFGPKVPIEVELPGDEQTLPFYGGLKGHYVHLKDGKVVEISENGKHTDTDSRHGPLAAASQLSVTAHNRQHVSERKPTFEDDFNKIQQAAARLVAIQELAKRRGNFSPEDNRVYAASLLELGQAAQSLATLQQTGQIQDFSILLKPMEDAAQMPQKTPFNSEKLGENGLEKVETVTAEQHFNESELLPANHDDPYEDTNDSVAITPPKKDASVAEARPVGVSIAGVGGVASAKPNAVALSGRNGLAVSAPKATALAGVTAEEAAAFSVALPGRHNLVIKNASTRFSSPSYDYYDEIESAPVQALLRTPNSGKSKSKPMQATVNAADAIVQMWRTAIAQDRAAGAAYDAGERNNDFNAEQYFKDFKKINQFHRN